MTPRDSFVEAMREARAYHMDCDDSWYSCPKSSDGCCNEDAGDECNCGADRINAALRKAAVAFIDADHALNAGCVLDIGDEFTTDHESCRAAILRDCFGEDK